ncbi:MAG: hypothetical protein IJ463_06805 [Bacilli bacterium]|nr:hypothetical protein [Bacilli bacterium]
MEKIDFKYINNYKKMNEFYDDWLKFIREQLNADTFNPKNIELTNNMKSYEFCLKSILMSLSRRIALLEEGFINFERSATPERLNEYNLMKNIIINPSTANESNENALGEIEDEYDLEYYGITYDDQTKSYYFEGKDDYFIQVPKVFEKIKIHENMQGTNADVFYQFRNCLVHREFSLELSSFSVDKDEINIGLDNIKINFDNGKVYGVLTLSELLEIVQIYEMFSLIFSDKKFEYLFEKYKSENEYEIKRYTCTPRKYDKDTEYEEVQEVCNFPTYFRDYMSYDNFYCLDGELGGDFRLWSLLRIFNYSDITCEDKDSEEKHKKMYEIIKKYCKSVWPPYHDESTIYKQINNIVNRYNCLLNNDVYLYDCEQRITFFKKFFGQQFFDMRNFKMYTPLSYYKDRAYNKYTILPDENGKNRILGFEDIATAPVLYTEFLLDSLFYNFNFAKETNAKEDGEIFRYKNIPLSDLDVYYTDGEKLEKTSPFQLRNTKDKVRDKKILSENEVFNYIRAFKNLIMFQDTENRNPERENQLIEAKRIIEELKDKYNLNNLIAFISKNLALKLGYDEEELISIFKKLCEPHKASELSDFEKAIKKEFVKKEFPKYEKREYSYYEFSPEIRYYDDYLNKDDSETTFEDSSLFMASLRNSITHGFYGIDFSNAFDENGKFDYDKILFTFYDINPATHQRVFEIRNISSKRVLQLIKDYSTVVLEEAEDKYIREDDNNHKVKKLFEEFMEKENYTHDAEISDITIKI